ncbi:hypothetical protein LSUE1_G002514 [Lachnellula suecica]|uniref:Uncharacterized protein n=1 Tax=Lachnellula suecica TaxID=602035 RepID=A0A8T9CG37_9HELO|nr:hypothetical protein LSUE1_G002514 [Lachnellula suecica]
MALVSASPIVVWKGEWQFDAQYIPKTEGQLYPQFSSMVRWKLVDQEAISASLKDLEMNILLCNKVVSREAAIVFYKMNTFSFSRQHNWDPIVSWLGAIGAENRGPLQSLDIDARQPDEAWQRSSGERLRLQHQTKEQLYPRHPYLQLRNDETPLKYGPVENINPAVETVFVLLGRRPSYQKITITMQVSRVYPGMRLGRDPFSQSPERDWFSMDLPNLMEKCRSLHTRNVEVLWKGEDERKEFEEQHSRLKSLGWDVTLLPTKEDTIQLISHYYSTHTTFEESRNAKYILRREEITEPLLASEPNPYHWIEPQALKDYD